MATTRETKPDGATRVIDTLEEMEESALESVRAFVDTVDGVFPAGAEDGPRRKVIDGAFRMVEQLVGASNRLAQNMVQATERALDQLDKEAPRRSTS